MRLILSLSLALTCALCPNGHADNPLEQLPDPYLQARSAVEARISIHRLMSIQLVDAIRLASGQKKWNGLRMNDRTDALEYLAKMSYEFFMVPDSFEGTKAKSSILQNINDFKSKSLATETAAMGLAQHSRMHDDKGATRAIGALISTCNACHQQYMEPALILPLPPKGPIVPPISLPINQVAR